MSYLTKTGSVGGSGAGQSQGHQGSHLQPTRQRAGGTRRRHQGPGQAVGASRGQGEIPGWYPGHGGESAERGEAAAGRGEARLGWLNANPKFTAGYRVRRRPPGGMQPGLVRRARTWCRKSLLAVVSVRVSVHLHLRLCVSAGVCVSLSVSLPPTFILRPFAPQVLSASLACTAQPEDRPHLQQFELGQVPLADPTSSDHCGVLESPWLTAG